MLHAAHLEHLRRAFAAQFAQNDAGYLYRHGQRGAPLKMTRAEPDSVVATIDRQMRWAARTVL